MKLLNCLKFENDEWYVERRVYKKYTNRSVKKHTVKIWKLTQEDSTIEIGIVHIWIQGWDLSTEKK